MLKERRIGFKKMSDPQNGRPPLNVWIHFVKNVKKTPKDITLHNASIVQKSLIVNNHKNFYHIWQTITLVVLMKLEENF